MSVDPLALLVLSGKMTIEQARELDDFASEIATRICNGELTEEQAHEIARERAMRDARAWLDKQVS